MGQTSSKDITYVIARYNEDINWLRPIFKNCVVYNKGKKLGIDNEIIVENVGRESETYLRYVIENYRNLPEIIIFSQADISDHVPHEYHDKLHEYLIKIKNEAKSYDKSLPIHAVYDHNDIKYGKSFPYGDISLLNYIKREDIENVRLKYPYGFGQWINKNLDIDFPVPINLYLNGLFAVKRSVILKHPVSYYVKLRKDLIHSSNPVEGHFFERAWYYIF